MAKTTNLLGNSGAATLAFGITRYIPITSGIDTSISTEAQGQTIFRTVGILANLLVSVKTNSLDATATIRLRKNTADGNQVVSVTAAATGVFEDITNSDTIAAGDLLNYSYVVAGASGTIAIIHISTIFITSGNLVLKLVCNGSGVYGVSSGTTFVQIMGGISFNVETRWQVRAKFPGTIKNLACYVQANARPNTSTVALRKNTADGNEVVSIGAAATGMFEDTANTDAVVVDDLLALRLTNGAGAGNIQIRIFSCEFEGTVKKVCGFGSTPGDTAGPRTTFANILGATNTTTVDTDTQLKFRNGYKISKYSASVPTNSNLGTTTETVRINGADTLLTVSVGASLTGFFEDNTNFATFKQNDTVNVKIITGSTGTYLGLGHTFEMEEQSVIDAVGGGMIASPR